MAVWVVRAGEKGAQEKFALNNGYAVISWHKMPHAIPVDRTVLREALRLAYPDDLPGILTRSVNETWNFAWRITVGDLLVLPLQKCVGPIRQNGVVAVGEFVGKYEHVGDGERGTKNRRKVRWLKRDIPRPRIVGAIPDNLEKRQTVFPLESSQAEERIRKIAEGR